MREFSEQEIVRRNKVEEIRKYTNPYPDKYKETKFNQNFRKEYGVNEPITKIRIERYERQLEEIRELIKQEESHLLIE